MVDSLRMKTYWKSPTTTGTKQYYFNNYINKRYSFICKSKQIFFNIIVS